MSPIYVEIIWSDENTCDGLVGDMYYYSILKNLDEQFTGDVTNVAGVTLFRTKEPAETVGEIFIEIMRYILNDLKLKYAYRTITSQDFEFKEVGT